MSSALELLHRNYSVYMTSMLSIPHELTETPIRSPVLREHVYLYIMFIVQGVICQTITIFGISNNIISCIIFVKQGFLDAINVSLLALSVSDLCSLICVMWTSLCFSPAIRDSDIPMVTTEVHLITGSWPHVVFIRTTGWITAFISLERCVCVSQPLKVKTIFTRKRHITAVIAIFGVTIVCSSLPFVSTGLGWVFYSDRNKTLIGLIYNVDLDARKYTDSISYAVSGVFMPTSCFLSVVILTTFLVVKLYQKAAWRMSVSSGMIHGSNTTGQANAKERKVAKMVVLMSVIFIISFLPAVGFFITGIVEPTFNYDRLNKNLLLVSLSISNTTEAINASVNIFIYVKMSSKYRETFLNMFKTRCNSMVVAKK